MTLSNLTTAAELSFIRIQARERKALAEIGVCYGGTSKNLREVMHPSGTLHLVDPFLKLEMTWFGTAITDDEVEAHKNVDSVENGSVVWHKMTSVEAAKEVPGPLDFVFIDGNHAYDFVTLDWALWSPKVQTGGVVLFHDVSLPGHPGVWKVFHDEALPTPGWERIGGANSVQGLRKL